MVRDIVYPTPSCVFDTVEARRHAAQGARRRRARTPSAGGTASGCEKGIEETYRWFLEQDPARRAGALDRDPVSRRERADGNHAAPIERRNGCPARSAGA